MRQIRWAIVFALEAFCGLIDAIPAYSKDENGKYRWWRHGDWGHRWRWLRPSDWSGALDERWGVLYWKPVVEDERTSN